jgi:hypothetical protein
MTRDKLDGEEAKVTNAYINRTVKEVHRVMGGLDPDIRLIVLARVQRDTAEQIQEVEMAAAVKRSREDRMGVGQE